MNYSLKVHPGAMNDLEAVALWIAEYSGWPVSDERVDAIIAAMRALENWPHRGNLQRHLGPDIRAIPVGKKAVVAFRVTEDLRTVEILAISYGGTDWYNSVVSRRDDIF